MKALATIAAELRAYAAEQDAGHETDTATLRWLARVADEAAHTIAHDLHKEDAE